MLEFITITALTLCYIKSCIDEKIKEEALKEKERIRDLKIKVFCYAVINGLLYDEVVEMIQNGTISFDDIMR